MDSSDPARGGLATDLAQIENLREARLSAATSNIPSIFWIILLLYVAAASFLSGREVPMRFGMQVNLKRPGAMSAATDSRTNRRPQGRILLVPLSRRQIALSPSKTPVDNLRDGSIPRVARANSSCR